MLSTFCIYNLVLFIFSVLLSLAMNLSKSHVSLSDFLVQPGIEPSTLILRIHSTFMYIYIFICSMLMLSLEGYLRMLSPYVLC